MSFKSINTLNKIPFNSKVLVYGAGFAGSYFTKILKLYRKDITIKGFIDDNPDIQKHNGHKVYNSNSISSIKNIDMIIIASKFVKQIKEKIKNINQETYEKSFFLNPFFYSGFLLSKDKWIKLNNYSDIEITNVPENLLKSFKKKTKKVENIFDKEEDKRLYRTLSKERIKFTNKIPSKLKKFNHIYKPYFDFINKSHINYIVEGGVFDGYTTLQFLNISENITIYGFEPNIDEYKKSFFYEELTTYENIIISNKALWSSTKELNFQVFDDNKAPGSQVVESDMSNHTVQGVSLDTIADNIKKIDFIKLDTEGSEIDILLGAKEQILLHRPQLAISIYHSHEDFITIPLMLKEWLDNYTFRLGHYSSNLNETILYAIPTEIYKDNYE